MSEFQGTIEFIKKLFGSENVLLHVPMFKGNEVKYVLDTLETEVVSSVGQYVEDFETNLANRIEVNKAVAVVNGTAAIQTALQLVGVQAGTEVLTQALTFVATSNAISYLNANPIFIDVDIDTMGMSPKSLEKFLEGNCAMKDGNPINQSTNRKITACLPMHTFGRICEIDRIVEICKHWQIPVVEDAAEALGSTYKGKSAGSFGDVGVFSFNGNKIVTSGGGGAIVTDNLELGDKAKYITTTAKVPHKWEYHHDILGYNFRMPNLNAALLCAQLEQLDSFVSAKRRLAKVYSDHFRKSKITFREEPQNNTSNYWLMAIEFPDKSERDSFLEYSNAHGVMTRPIWQLMYRLPMYKRCTRDEQINAEYLEQRIVNIPSSVIK